jgi:very-short-patch-repair endonuclease
MARARALSLPFRRELRRESTDAELAVWWMLRSRHFGVKFRRQHSVDRYVLDFYCVELKLAIELDGGQHFEERGLEYDAERGTVLNALGIRTLRFTNAEVARERSGVAEAIWDEVELRAKPPSPRSSPPAGRGER